MDVRIGVTYTPKEIEVEVDGDSQDDVKAKVEAALDGGEGVLWLTDVKGRTVGIPADKISWVELGSPDTARRVGFAAK